MTRIILHVDLNSFFARATQQANPALRGKPVGIVKALGRTCIIAASIEAKRYGVVTGCRVSDAKKMCPQIILMPADFDKYEDISLRFIKICAQYSPLCEVFSLDECFIDVSETADFWAKAPQKINLQQLAYIELAKSWQLSIGAVNIAFEIKRRLREEIGDFLTCSVGISHNRLLAKLASSQIKYDGLFWITGDNAFDVLDKSNLMDVCGIGWGLYKHLAALGIDNFSKLRDCSIQFLYKNFGPFWSYYLYDICRGIDPTPVNSFRSLPKQKSVGRTYTTHKPLNSRKDTERLIRNLAEEAAFKARTMDLAGRYVGLRLQTSASHWSELKGKESQSWYGHRILKNYIDDGKKLFDLCRLISKDWEFKNIIFCGVTLGMLTRKGDLSLPLFFDDKRRQDLTEAADSINRRFGDYTLFPAQLLGMDIIRPEVTGYFGDKSFRLGKFLRNN